jgi:hypothetical protein
MHNAWIVGLQMGHFDHNVGKTVGNADGQAEDQKSQHVDHFICCNFYRNYSCLRGDNDLEINKKNIHKLTQAFECSFRRRKMCGA